MSDEYTYFSGRRPDKTYTSKAISSRYGETVRNVRILTKVFDSPEGLKEAKIHNEIILRTTPAGRQQIKAKLFEDDRHVFVLTFQRFTTETGMPHELYFSFVGNEITQLKDFIDSANYIVFEGQGKERLDDKRIQELRQTLLKKENVNLLIELARNEITKADVITIAYRKEQLNVFEQLLSNHNYFLEKKVEWKKQRPEDVWQFFFEKNPWIFGYGLNFIFNTPLQNKKLEQVVRGADIVQGGKRADALLKSRGIINSLCLVEIKTHQTKLLDDKPYRSDSWKPSNDLSGGISQSQKTTQKSLENIGSKIEPTMADGFPTGETIFSYNPKTYLVIGSLAEFKSETGINKEKFSSFELFRKSLTSPEIITFDELYERAKFIVHTNEEQNQSLPSPNIITDNNFENDDIPF